MSLRSPGFRKAFLFVILSAAAAGLLWKTVEPLISDSAAAETRPTTSARVKRVIDGDTLVVTIGSREERVRLLGVDTPEMPRRGWSGEYLADEARAFVEQQVGRGEVRLARDPQRKDRDSYDRLLRYVELPDGRLLNAELIRQGFAYAFTRYSLMREDEFLQYEAAARAAGLGVWAEAGRAELRWNEDHGVEPVRLHPMGNRSWAIEYDGRVKPWVRPGELVDELSNLRRVVERSHGEERKARLDEEGYLR